MKPRNAQSSRFSIRKLELRVAPAATALIPSVNLDDPSVNGAEHALPGLDNNHAGDDGWIQHGGVVESAPHLRLT